MTDTDQIYDTNMRERNNRVISDADKAKEQQESLSAEEEADLDDIPPSLLSYFETSRNRAAVCENFILEKPEDFSESHHTEDMINLLNDLDEDMMKLNEQVACDTNNEENNSFTDTRLLPAPTETQELFTHNASVCPNNEDEAKTDECMEISLNEEERKKGSEYEAERERRHYEEKKKEEQKRQIERDFQMELKKIMELEKLHQKELEMMQKRAQEKLDQELQLQQELISNLQRRVDEERRRREEEQKRMKAEEDKRKREEEKMKMEAERKRMEEERKIEEMNLKKEEKRTKEEREQKRKREEEQNKVDLEKKKLEDEMRMMKEEEEKKKKEEVERIRKEEEGKREEERKNIEEARKKMEKEKREIQAEMSLRKEEEDRKKREEENMRVEVEGRITKETEERKKQVEVRKRKEEEEEADAGKKMHEELRKRDKKEHRNVDEEIKLEERENEEDKGSKKREDEKEKKYDRQREKERKMMEEKKEVIVVVRKKEGENGQMKEEPRPIEEDEKRKREVERQTKEEEQRRQKEEMRRKSDKEDYGKSEEEIRLKEDEEGYKGDDRRMERESKAKDKEKRQEEKRKREEEERKNVEAEKKQNEEVGQVGPKEKKEGKKRMVKEKEVGELQEKEKKREESVMSQNQNIDQTENSLISQLEDTWTSSSPGPLHTTQQQQHDLHNNISQTCVHTTVDCGNKAATPFLPVCLPEHTEQKRLSWMKDCVPWSKLSAQNRRKQKGPVHSRRALRRTEASGLPPLCPDSLLQSAGWKSLQEVTTVTLEDLPGCSLSTLAQCIQLRSLTLRRCGLKSLEGIKQLPQLCNIDVQENDISFVDCENMTSLRVLHLGHNKLTSVHGLTGAENVDILDLSHNSITRIAGLESMRSLQRLSVDHNQLISTKGLRDVYTLLHLSCSHNHLASVEGLENSALLGTLDLRANSLTEPPSLNNQVLLRELRLDDNSISSLEAFTACWLPLMQHLSVAQNRITQLPSMSDSVSLANLDLRFNCISELQNVCESLEGCQVLREVHLTGNPLEQESGWRFGLLAQAVQTFQQNTGPAIRLLRRATDICVSTLQKAVPGLRAIDDPDTASPVSPTAVQQVSLVVDGFLVFCRAQLQQTRDLQQRHRRERSNASSSLDAVKTSCRHFAEALQLAMEQRFAHEYGDTTMAAGLTTPEETLDMDSTNLEKSKECSEMESNEKVPPVIPNGENIRCSYNWTFEEKSVAESRHDTVDAVTTGPKTVTVTKANSLATKGKTISSNPELALVSNRRCLDLQKSTAAVVIQQLWRKYRQKCGNISSPSTAEKGGGRGGDGGKPESGHSYSRGSQDYAATVIQAFWRGFTLRRRLASALAAVTCLDTGEDDTFEEVDVDEFVFDEAALEKHWTLPLSEDSPPRCDSEPKQSLSLKSPGPFPEPPQYILPPPFVWRSKQAWVVGEQVDSASPVSSLRSKSPASPSAGSGLSERSEKILEEWGFTHSHTALLMLKRAQKMKSKKQQQRRQTDPSARLGLFRNCSYQLGPVEARNRPAQHNRNYIKVREAELGLQPAERTVRAKQEQRLHTQAAHSDRDSESLSVHFLPEISSGILNGGRVQLVADPGYTERLHHASGLWANNSLAAQPCKENNCARRNSLGHARKQVPPPKRVTSAPSTKERISFRDNPVQMSGGWGGGKKRDKV